MNKHAIWFLGLVAMVANSGLYGALARVGSPEQGVTITTIQQMFPYEKKIVIKSKVAGSVFLTFFDDSFRKPITIGSSAIIELRENQQIVINSIKDDGRLVVLAARDRARLDEALKIAKGDKRNNYIRNQVDSSADVFYFKPKMNEFFLLYMNNQGLIPGLLRGVGDVYEERVKINTKPGKICSLRLAYKAKNTFTIEQKPQDYKNAAEKTAKASSSPTIEGVVDDVVAFEKAKGL
jgi:hypothetical protein